MNPSPSEELGFQSPGPGAVSGDTTPFLPTPTTLETAASSAPNEKKKGPQKKQARPAAQRGGAGAHKKKQEKKSTVDYSIDDMSAPFPEDLRVLCYTNGTFMQAVVLQASPKDEVFIEPSDSIVPYPYPPETVPYDYSSHESVYYVHYVRWDRRMDEWVSRERLRLPQELVRFTIPPAQPMKPPHEVDDVPVDAQMPVSGAATATLSAEALAAKEHHEKLLGMPTVELLAKYPVQNVAFDGPTVRVETAEEAVMALGPHAHDDEDHQAVTKVKNINEIVLGKYIMPTWYFSPFPEEYKKCRRLHFCEYCLLFFAHQNELIRHQSKCTIKHPPGNEIYRSQETNVEVCMYEVDGQKERVYCENLCYIAKLFLDHKTLFEDCSIFLFYVLCEVTPHGSVVVGYFSKEKLWSTNNLACTW